MRLTAVYVRFYKSFNYDYERKFAERSRPDPWEKVDGAWYPYVRMRVEPSVTTIVGANEAGKSHLLDAIEKLLTGEGIIRSDFCRYSHFFSVEQGRLRCPDFGGEFELAEPADTAAVKEHLGLEMAPGGRFHLFRPNGESPVVYAERSQDAIPVPESALPALLPAVFRLDARVPLPASIPLHALVEETAEPYGSRKSRRHVLRSMLGRSWGSVDELSKAASSLFPALSETPGEARESSRISRQYDLARALLFRVARIDPEAFRDLSDAIADEREGYVNGVIQKVNAALARHLNFPRWWAQDREFRLMVSPREYDLVFTIRDRTGTDYSFAERSHGLKFFLSYYVQLLAHEAPETGQPEILLMDEPDAYLSSQGQQDLLRILEQFAVPEDRSVQRQVVYVTHSPYLINRNAGHRIRVLDKGATDEGTRVVKDVARNHYEPLRSSLGAFVAETSFIGGQNLFVEGLADQVLLAGISAHLLRRGAPERDVLDLNKVTIVPAGSASSIPYLVYLARGRDVVRPPCVALLDSDQAGDDAVKALRRGGPRRKGLLRPELIVQVGEWAKTALEKLRVAKNVAIAELDDLVPLPVAVSAARNYARKVLGAAPESAEGLSEADLTATLEATPGSLFDALSEAFTHCFGPEAHLEKVGFAREIVSLAASRTDDDAATEAIDELEHNYGLLIARLARLLHTAQLDEDERRRSNRLERVIASFIDDYPEPTARERGATLAEDVLASLADSDEGDRIRLAVERLRREFHLDEDITKPIDGYETFRQRVQALLYEGRLANQDPEETVAAVHQSINDESAMPPSESSREDPDGTGGAAAAVAREKGASSAVSRRGARRGGS